MSKMTHKQKVKIARAGRTRQELMTKTSIWNTKFWNERKAAIAKRTNG